MFNTNNITTRGTVNNNTSLTLELKVNVRKPYSTSILMTSFVTETNERKYSMAFMLMRCNIVEPRGEAGFRSGTLVWSNLSHHHDQARVVRHTGLRSIHSRASRVVNAEVLCSSAPGSLYSRSSNKWW